LRLSSTGIRQIPAITTHPANLPMVLICFLASINVRTRAYHFMFISSGVAGHA